MTVRQRFDKLIAPWKMAAAFGWGGFGPITKGESAGSADGAPTRSYTDLAKDAYERSPWVHRSIRELAEAVMSVSWMAQDIATEEALPRHHPLAALLRQPSPGKLTWAAWAERWVTYLILSGDVIAEKIMMGERLVSLDLHQPNRVQPERADGRGKILRYKISHGTQHRFLMPEQVIRWVMLDPLDEQRGLSPLTPAAAEVDLEARARGWNRALLKNSAVPSSTFTVPAEKKLSEIERRSLRSSLQEGFSGDRAFEPLLLEGGAVYNRISQSSADMQLNEITDRSARKIASVLGMPPWAVGIAEPKYENYRQSRLALWEDSVIPLLDRLRDGLEMGLMVEFPGARPMYDLGGTPALRDSFMHRLESAKKLAELGYPPNMINERLNLGMPDVPWGDEALMPAGLAPASELVEPMDPPAENDAT